MCARCGKEQPVYEFFFNNTLTSGRASSCKECIRKYAREYYKSHPRTSKRESKETSRKRRLKRLYNVAPERYDQLVLKQNNKCAICGTSTPGTQTGVWHIDHNHKTKKVRGLLCFYCNSLLGYARDSIETLENSIKYLKKDNDMVVDDYIMSMAIFKVWQEQKEGLLNEVLAALFVFRNRVKANWFNGNWSDVISNHKPAMVSKTINVPDVRDPVFKQLLSLVDSVYDNTGVDKLTDGAFYFARIGDGSTIEPWFQEEILNKPSIHPRISIVGETSLFK